MQGLCAFVWNGWCTAACLPMQNVQPCMQSSTCESAHACHLPAASALPANPRLPCRSTHGSSGNASAAPCRPFRRSQPRCPPSRCRRPPAVPSPPPSAGVPSQGPTAC
eukprot:366097-Chlamydomonas_euryale.AAC.53